MRVLLKLLQGAGTGSELDIQALSSRAQLCMLTLNSQLRIPSAPLLCVKLSIFAKHIVTSMQRLGHHHVVAPFAGHADLLAGFISVV